MKQQQQLVQPAGVLIPAKYVLSWSQNAMRIKHVLMLHKRSPLLTPKVSLPLLLFGVLWQVVFSIQIFTNSQDSGILIQHAFKTWPRRQRVLQKGYHVEHFFIWHHCSCSPIPSACNTTTTPKKQQPILKIQSHAYIEAFCNHQIWNARNLVLQVNGRSHQLFFCCFWAWEFSSPKATECPLDLPWFTYSKTWTSLKLCNKVMLSNFCLVTYTYDESYAW